MEFRCSRTTELRANSTFSRQLCYETRTRTDIIEKLRSSEVNTMLSSPVTFYQPLPTAFLRVLPHLPLRCHSRPSPFLRMITPTTRITLLIILVFEHQIQPMFFIKNKSNKYTLNIYILFFLFFCQIIYFILGCHVKLVFI